MGQPRNRVVNDLNWFWRKDWTTSDESKESMWVIQRKIANEVSKHSLVKVSWKLALPGVLESSWQNTIKAVEVFNWHIISENLSLHGILLISKCALVVLVNNWYLATWSISVRKFAREGICLEPKQLNRSIGFVWTSVGNLSARVRRYFGSWQLIELRLSMKEVIRIFSGISTWPNTLLLDLGRLPVQASTLQVDNHETVSSLGY